MKSTRVDSKDTALAKHPRRHEAGTAAAAAGGGGGGGGGDSNSTRRGGSNMQPRCVRRSLPVTTSEVASCMSRKRKMGTFEEGSSSPTLSHHHHDGRRRLVAAVTVPVSPANTAAANSSSRMGSAATTKLIGNITPFGRPHTAPAAGPTTCSTKSPGVRNIADINSTPSCCTTARCPHRRDHNSAQSLTISFLNAYGEDYCAKQRRIDDEQGERPDLSLILSDKSLQRYLTESDRVHAIEWMSELSATLDLLDSTFHSSVAFLDRLLATLIGMKDEDFHRAALACVFVASKMIETKWEDDMAAQDFINASPHDMHAQDLIHLESNVCNWLDYRLHAITPLCFLDRFLHASNPTMHYSDAMLREERLTASGWSPANLGLSKPRGTLESLALYFLELATHSTELSMQKPDRLAASAVYLARATFGINAGIDENVPPSSPPVSLFWNEILEYYTDYRSEELEDIVRAMHELHCDTNHSVESTYVYEKFSTETYKFVSFVPPLLKADLGFL